jgi:hypothetical protein
MCLMLYMATQGEQPLRSAPELSVEEVERSREAVRQWLSLPTVRFIGAHTGCSCGFPSVTAEEPIEYWEGMFHNDENRQADLISLRSLLTLVREHVAAAGEVELYGVWNGEEGSPPKGTIDLELDALNPETFFFNEQFLYRVRQDRTRRDGSASRGTRPSGSGVS